MSKKTNQLALALAVTLSGTGIYAAFDGAYGAEKKAEPPAPADASKEGSKKPANAGKKFKKVTVGGVTFYECWNGGPIVLDPRECPPKETR